MKVNSSFSRAALALVLALPLTACDKVFGPSGEARVLLASSSTSSASFAQAAFEGSSLNGQVPLSSVSAIEVKINRVDALPSGQDLASEAAWATMNLTAPSAVNLMALSEGGVEIAREGLAPGTYTGVRLFFESAVIRFSQDVTVNGKVYAAGTDHALVIPSGAQTGIKVPSASFTVSEDVEAPVVVEFDKSLSVQGIQSTATGLKMSPVLKSRS